MFGVIMLHNVYCVDIRMYILREQQDVGKINLLSLSVLDFLFQTEW